jgi:NodT family efflux transporter outer membrane factor (OMF) lipoprotein
MLVKSLKTLRLLPLGISVWIVSSCTMVGPEYKAPVDTTMPEWIDTEGFSVTAQENIEWWNLLKDPNLDLLIKTAHEDNLDLQSAALRILEARAALGIAYGSFWPQEQSIQGGASTIGVSDNSANSQSADGSFKNYQVGMNASWELDFWGKYRRIIHASKLSLDAQLASYDNLIVSLSAEVAKTYIQICVKEERLSVVKMNIESQKKNQKIVKVRFDNGDVSELDYQQATILLNETESFIPRVEADLRKLKNSLAVLLGRNPGQVDTLLKGDLSIPELPAELAISAPNTLLRRRPDIRQAEYQLAIQGERIGISRADLFPHVGLFGSVGLQTSNNNVTKNNSSNVDNLFDKESFFYQVGPQFKWDLFNYGQLKNKVRAEDAVFEQTANFYYQSVLKAQQEVEDSFADISGSQRQLLSITKSVEAAKRSVELSEIEYKNGKIAFESVLSSLDFLNQLESKSVLVRGEVILGMVSLYKNLGGGWEASRNTLPIKKETLDRMRERTDWGDVLDKRPSNKVIDEFSKKKDEENSPKE